MDDITESADREAAATRDRKLQLRLWLRLLTCARMIEAEVRTRLRAEFDTTLPRFDVLAQLDAAQGHLTMGELSARLMVTNGNVTGLVSAMERDGLLLRQPHPTDGRSMLIEMTPTGRAAFARMAPTHENWVDAMMRDMTRGEMAQLLNLLGELKDSVRTNRRS